MRVKIFAKQGKARGSREAVVNQLDPAAGMEQVFADLRCIHGDLQPNTRIFALPDGVLPEYSRIFRNLLVAHGLYHEPGTSVQRSLYSLRHYYANTMIENGTEIYMLAKIMGTSISMIDQYYGKALSRRSQAKVAGVANAKGRIRGAISRSILVEDLRDRVADENDEPDEWLH